MKATKLKFTFVVLLLPLFVSGCLIAPHTRVVSQSVQGRVVDNITNEPVPNASIKYYRTRTDKYFTTTTSDQNGNFRLKPIKQWHWIVYIGSPGYHPFPESIRAAGKPYCFDVVAEGYESEYLRVQSHELIEGCIGTYRSIAPPSPLIIGLTPANLPHANIVDAPQAQP